VYRYSLGGKRTKVNEVYWTPAPENMTNNMEMIEGNMDAFENSNNLSDFLATDHTVMLTPDAGAEAALTGFPQLSHGSFNPFNILILSYQVRHSGTLLCQRLNLLCKQRHSNIQIRKTSLTDEKIGGAP
jgi:hypothetical protein